MMLHLRRAVARSHNVCPDILCALSIRLFEHAASINPVLSTEAEESFAGIAILVKRHLQEPEC